MCKAGGELLSDAQGSDGGAEAAVVGATRWLTLDWRLERY